MKPLYTKKNGTSQRVAAIEVKMPASYPSANVTYGSGSVEDALDDLTPRFRTVTSGSLHDILTSGIYYVTNSVTDKPTSTGGAYFVSSTGSVVGGLFIQVGTGKAYVVRYSDSTWTYTPLN